MQNGDTSTEHICKEAFLFIDTTTSPNKAAFAKRFGRWYNFWKSRYDANGYGSTVPANLFAQLQGGSTIPSQASPTGCGIKSFWKLLGPKQSPGQYQNLGIITSVYSPWANSDTVYAGSNSGGLWRTDNANASVPKWRCLTDDPNLPAMGISALAVNPNNSNELYIATGYSINPQGLMYGSGVLKSLDGGLSWINTGLTWSLSEQKIITALKINPDNPNIIYAGIKGNSDNSGQVYKSIDAGLTWYQVFLDVFSFDYIHDIEFLPNNSNVVFVSDGNFNNWDYARIYVNWNGGEGTLYTRDVTLQPVLINPSNGFNSTNRTINFAKRIALATTAARPDAIYMHFGSNQCRSRFFSSVDSGRTWIAEGSFSIGCSEAPNEWKNEFAISQINPNIMYFGAIQFRIYNKANNSVSTTSAFNFGVETHGDIRDIQVHNSTTNPSQSVILIATDGGISRSLNGGIINSWRDLNGDGPAVTQYFDMDVSSLKKNYFAAGAQDNSTYFYDGGNWGNAYNGDGGQTVIDWSNPNVIFYRANPTIYKRVNGADVGSTILDNSQNEFVDGIVRQDPINPDYLYVAKRTDFRRISIQTMTTLQSFVDIMRQAGNNTLNKYWISDFQISPIDNNIIYAALRGQSDTIGTPNLKRDYQLLKSSDGGQSWSRTTANPIYEYYNIKNICLHETDSNKLWIGLDGLIGLVYYSADGGSTWTLRNAGLPQVPINCIIRQKGVSKDILYAGTDLGVFYSNNGGEKWECFNDSLPIIIVSDLEINYCEKKLYAATYGRGIWSTPLVPVLDTLLENNTIAQASTKHFANDLIVPKNKTLTIYGKLNMGKDTKIIIEPGGRLNLIGGTITNLCGETWQGIEVWGKGSGTVQNNQNQGYLFIENGTIEYAREAIRLWKPGDSTTTGGLVQATKATFRNNWRTVEFMKYQNGFLISGQQTFLPNNSFFVNCDFIINDNYRAFVASVPFKGFMSLWQVDGVQIRGCNFENRIDTNSLFVRAEDYGYGILTIDAHFKALHACISLDCSIWKPNTFYRLFEGIRISKVSSPLSPVVDRAVFRDCHNGVFNDMVNSFSLTRSQFEVGGFPKNAANSANLQEGLVLNRATGFKITENLFNNSSSNPTGAMILGTRTVNAGANDNRIYKNTLNTQLGHLANGRNGQLIQVPFSGMRYECNSHSFAISDIIAYSGTKGFAIAPDQGSSARPTGNTFSYTLRYNVNNYQSPQQVVNYYYGPNTIENPQYISNVNVFSINTLNQCPSDIPTNTSGDISKELSISERAALQSNFQVAEQNYLQKRDSFNQKIDQGRSAYWLNRVQTAGPANVANNVAKDLEKDVSPWVSEPICRALFANNNFSNNKIHKVLEANPDVLRNNDFMDFTINSGRFTAQDIVKLKNAAQLQTIRNQEQSLVSSAFAEHSSIVQAIIRDELNKETGINWFEVDAWLQKIPSEENDYTRVELYRSLSDWGKSTYILDSMPNKYQLTGQALTDHQEYRQLHLQLCALDLSGGKLLDLSKSQLEQLANKGWSRASMQAQAILNFAFDGNYHRPALFPDDIQAKPLMELTKNQEVEAAVVEEMDILTLQPNPAKDQVQLSFKLPEGKREAILKVIDLQGRLLYSSSIQENQKEHSLNVNNWTAGQYYVFLEGKNWRSASVGLVIVK